MVEYIWQLENWTQFHFDVERVLPELSKFRKKQGYFLCHVYELGFEKELHAYAKIVEEDALKTSAIEGITLDKKGVRSSVARHLGLEQAGLRQANHETDGLVTVLLDAVYNYAKPLDKKGYALGTDFYCPMFSPGLLKLRLESIEIRKCNLYQVAMEKKKSIFEPLSRKMCPGRCRISFSF